MRWRSIVGVLLEVASKEESLVDQAVIRYFALLAANGFLTESSRAVLVNHVSRKRGVTPQYVRQRLGAGSVLVKIKDALRG